METLAQLYLYTARLIALSMLISLSACKHSTDDPVVIPQAAQAIAGTYQAQTFTMGSSPETYPINGQTITVQIKPLTATTVQVDITASANDKYSPGQNLSYSNVTAAGNPTGDATSAYSLVLNPSTRCGYDAMNVYAQGRMDYYYIPPGGRECNGATIRLQKQP